MSSRKATYHECDTVLGLEDIYDILEVICVDAHNQNAARKHYASKQQ